MQKPETVNRMKPMPSRKRVTSSSAKLIGERAEQARARQDREPRERKRGGRSGRTGAGEIPTSRP
jgi:hypothetical protein